MIVFKSAICTRGKYITLNITQGFIVTATKAANNLLGYGNGELEGKSIDTFFPEKAKETEHIKNTVKKRAIKSTEILLDKKFGGLNDKQLRYLDVDGSSSRKYQGTGLGLSLAKNLVELHGSKIAADSEGKGRGSTFNFMIPIHM